MNKLIIAVAAVALAIGAQAAAVSWKSGNSVKPDGSTTAESGTLNMYVWILSDKTAYDALTDAQIWSTYGNTKISEISGFSASATGKSGTSSFTATGTPTAAGDYYGVIIGTYDKNKDGTVDMYTVNKVTANINDAGTVTKNSNALRYIGGLSDNGNVTWTAAAVPEPTSAMLLLLGVAGLALRRRRA